MKHQVLTTQQLAVLTRLPAGLVAELLADEERRGQVTRTGDGWRLAEAFERRFGRYLRDVDRPNRIDN